MFTRRLPSFVVLKGLLVILLGLLALVGWQFDNVLLKSIFPGVTPMNPVTALTFILSGIWLILFQKKRANVLRRALALSIIYIGFVHAFTYLIPLNALRFDHLLFGDKLRKSTVFNLVAPNTASLFLLTGITMLLADSRNKYAHYVRQGLIFLGFFVAYVSTLGYVFHIQPAYRVGGLTPMALFTGITFIMLQVGMFVSVPGARFLKTYYSAYSGGNLLRWFTPLVLIFPPVTGYLRLLGERRGIFPAEVGVELNTLLFEIILFACVFFYASLENKKQIGELRDKRALALSESRFRALFNAIREGVVSVSANAVVNYCNPAFAAITGFRDDEIVGKNIARLLIPDGERKDFYRRAGSLRAGTDEVIETEIIRKNGERRWISIKSRPQTAPDGSIECYIATVADITEERLNLQDLKAFTASAAHDLNAPLARVQVMAELMGTDNFDDDQKLMMEGILSTTTAMRHLLQDLLFFSKLGATQLEKQEINLDTLVREICNNETPETFAGQINVHHLPPVEGSKSAIRQLYTNLVSNAIKYSSKSESPRIEIGAYHKNQRTVYYVKDNGVGLAKDQIEKLFTPFKRFHGEFEGNGMGLAIVKRIVNKHGGKIWAESVEHQGITFYFTLSPGTDLSPGAQRSLGFAA